MMLHDLRRICTYLIVLLALPQCVFLSDEHLFQDSPTHDPFPGQNWIIFPKNIDQGTSADKDKSTTLQRIKDTSTFRMNVADEYNILVKFYELESKYRKENQGLIIASSGSESEGFKFLPIIIEENGDFTILYNKKNDSKTKHYSTLRELIFEIDKQIDVYENYGFGGLGPNTNTIGNPLFLDSISQLGSAEEAFNSAVQQDEKIDHEEFVAHLIGEDVQSANKIDGETAKQETRTRVEDIRGRECFSNELVEQKVKISVAVDVPFLGSICFYGGEAESNTNSQANGPTICKGYSKVCPD